MFSGVVVSSDATGRSSWENILASVIQSTCFPSVFAFSKSVLTVTVVLYLQPSILQAIFSLQNFIDHNCQS